MSAAPGPSAAAAARYGLSGRTCLVTGGTKGIGRAVVEEMCALGGKVDSHMECSVIVTHLAVQLQVL